MKVKLNNAVKALQTNIDWSGKLEREEYIATGTLDQAMKNVNSFFDSNKSVFEEMDLYRHYASYDLKVESYHKSFNDQKITIKKDMLRLSNVIEDVKQLTQATAEVSNKSRLILKLRSDHPNM